MRNHRQNLKKNIKPSKKNYRKEKRYYIWIPDIQLKKSKLVEEFIKDKKIEIHILPPYIPNLNPIEHLWN